MKTASKHILFVVLALVITSATPLAFVTMEKTPLKNSSNEMYEVYKSGLPLRYIERSNISTSINFNKKYFVVNGVTWYVFLLIIMFSIKKITRLSTIINYSTYNRSLVSILKCNKSLIKNFLRCLKCQSFSWPSIKFVSNSITSYLRQARHTFAFWEILPNQPICVFICASFP